MSRVNIFSQKIISTELPWSIELSSLSKNRRLVFSDLSSVQRASYFTLIILSLFVANIRRRANSDKPTRTHLMIRYM